MVLFVCPPFIVGPVQVGWPPRRIHRDLISASEVADRSIAKRQVKGLFVASKSGLYVGSRQQTASRSSNAEGAPNAESRTGSKARFKAVITATMKRRALKPKKAKAERSR